METVLHFEFLTQNVLYSLRLQLDCVLGLVQIKLCKLWLNI
jgi:hypothetical protein